METAINQAIEDKNYRLLAGAASMLEVLLSKKFNQKWSNLLDKINAVFEGLEG